MLERQWAEHLIQQHWAPRPTPVDPVAIARAMGVEVRFCSPFEDDFAFGASGTFEYEGNRPVIRVNAGDSPNRQRFTIAHELGHHILGHAVGGKRFRDTSATLSGGSYDPVEVSANRFAAELVMPAYSVKVMVEDRRVSSIAELASAMGVSEIAMQIRLKNLGYIS